MAGRGDVVLLTAKVALDDSDFQKMANVHKDLKSTATDATIVKHVEKQTKEMSEIAKTWKETTEKFHGALQSFKGGGIFQEIGAGVLGGIGGIFIGAITGLGEKIVDKLGEMSGWNTLVNGEGTEEVKENIESQFEKAENLKRMAAVYGTSTGHLDMFKKVLAMGGVQDPATALAYFAESAESNPALKNFNKKDKVEAFENFLMTERSRDTGQILQDFQTYMHLRPAQASQFIGLIKGEDPHELFESLEETQSVEDQTKMINEMAEQGEHATIEKYKDLNAGEIKFDKTLLGKGKNVGKAFGGVFATEQISEQIESSNKILETYYNNLEKLDPTKYTQTLERVLPNLDKTANINKILLSNNTEDVNKQLDAVNPIRGGVARVYALANASLAATGINDPRYADDYKNAVDLTGSTLNVQAMQINIAGAPVSRASKK